MAETHQEVVKVWIAPGCIVCDACETDCPEVFDVQEETCIIRPEATKPDFTKPLTPSIMVAAEGCPVDVIKFETIEVEGPAPWAGQEAAAAAAAEAGEAKAAPTTKKKPAFSVGDGPPDPRWAGLLTHARTTGSRSAGGVPVSMKSAHAPAEAVAMMVPRNSPPDAMAAAMVGSGYARPRRSAVQRIREQAGRLTSAAAITRREFNVALAIGWGSMLLLFATLGAAFQSFMIPKVTKEPPSTFRAGRLSEFSEPGVYERHKPNNVWIVHQHDGKLVALSTICTHLGCIPNWLVTESKFKCPCHGSGFYMNGVNFEGPAPRPLERLAIRLDGEFVVVDKSQIFRQELQQWGLEGSEIAV